MNNSVNINNNVTNDHMITGVGGAGIGSDQIDLNCGNWSQEELKEYYGSIAQYQWW